MMHQSTKSRQLISLLTLICSFYITPCTHATLSPNSIEIKILGINDFHGQISSGRFVAEQPVGGAVVLASYLKHRQDHMEDRTLITIMGDQVGASPAASALLHDEPTILFTNSLGNKHCSNEDRMNPLCNIVATIGNHEFDKGSKALFDLIYGQNKPPTDNWIPLPTYPGTNYPYISANIVDEETKKPLFPPYIIKEVQGVPIAFIGAILKDAADIMFPANAKGITFLDEATAINQYIPEIKNKGVKIIIVLIHEGGNNAPYNGDTKNNTEVQGNIKKIVAQLDNVNVVMCGHTHQFLNAYLPDKQGKSVLVTQANSYSSSFAEVTLQVSKKTHSVLKKSAQIITTYADRFPGTIGNEEAQKIVQFAESKVAPIMNSYVGTTDVALLRKVNEDGESNLGNLVADAYRVMMASDIGLANIHGLRDDIHPGVVNGGVVYSVLPFANTIVTLSLTGADIYDLLEQQWTGSNAEMLQISGMSYTYDSNQPIGHRVVEIQHQGEPLVKNKLYIIATSDFLAAGSGTFSVMTRGKLIKTGASDYETVVQYIKQLPQPFVQLIEGRIKQISGFQ